MFLITMKKVLNVFKKVLKYVLYVVFFKHFVRETPLCYD